MHVWLVSIQWIILHGISQNMENHSEVGLSHEFNTVTAHSAVLIRKVALCVLNEPKNICCVCMPWSSSLACWKKCVSVGRNTTNTSREEKHEKEFQISNWYQKYSEQYLSGAEKSWRTGPTRPLCYLLGQSYETSRGRTTHHYRIGLALAFDLIGVWESWRPNHSGPE